MRTTALALTLFLSASMAFATDLFTLNVPVQVSHLHPSVTQIRVNCHIKGLDAATGNPVNYGPAMGKSQDFTVAGGAFSGTAHVVFTNSDFSTAELNNLSSVSNGECHLTLIAGGNLYQAYSYSTGPVVAHQSGTPFSTQVNFAIH
jgi:hypothetical protein